MSPDPVRTDRRGYMVSVGDTVQDIEDDFVFVVERVFSYTDYFPEIPAVFIVCGGTAAGRYRHIDASRTIFLQRPSGKDIERARFCSGCSYNYAKQEIKKHNCSGSRKIQKRALRGVLWCVPRLLRWKYRALQYYQGSLATLRAEGIAAHNSLM